MNTLNFLAGQNILWSIFCVSSETIFQQFRVFIKEELTQVFEMLERKKCLGGSRVERGEERPMPYYIICDGLTITTAVPWQAVQQNMWNELHLLIKSTICIHCESWYVISKVFLVARLPRPYLFYLSPLCCAGAVSGLHLYIATLLLLLRGNVLIQGYIVFTSTQMI